jgi:hypothetical protein
MAANALKKITTRAKQIRKKQPGKSWKSAVKQAGAEYRAGNKKPVRKKRAKAVGKAPKAVAKRKSRVGTKPKYQVIHEVRKIGRISYKGGSVTVAGTGDVNRKKDALRAALGEQAGWLDVAISSEKTKAGKNRLRKKKREVISELNRIK